MAEEQDWNRIHSRREQLAASRKKKRRRNISLAATAAVVIIAFFVLLGPWGLLLKDKPAAKPTAAKTKAKATSPSSAAAADTQPHETLTSAPAAGTSESTPAASQPAPTPAAAPPALTAPLEAGLAYPYTKDASVACGHWSQGSEDYPYFGAPRANGRLHAGIDVYPRAGAGAPVKALKDGRVIKVALFYTRASGEQTYGVLVDHGDFVANYAELQPTGLKAGDSVAGGSVIGHVSGTQQLHFEMYAPGTTNWINWYGSKPANLTDPTAFMQNLVN